MSQWWWGRRSVHHMLWFTWVPALSRRLPFAFWLYIFFWNNKPWGHVASAQYLVFSQSHLNEGRYWRAMSLLNMPHRDESPEFRLVVLSGEKSSFCRSITFREFIDTLLNSSFGIYFSFSGGNHLNKTQPTNRPADLNGFSSYIIINKSKMIIKLEMLLATRLTNGK